MNDDLRQAQLRVLEDAAAADPRSPVFDEFLNALHMSSQNRDELLRIVLEQRWRRSSQPLEYVRRRVLASVRRDHRDVGDGTRLWRSPIQHKPKQDRTD